MNAAMFGFYIPNGREKTVVEQSTAPELLHLRGKPKPIVLIYFQQKALFVCNLFQTQTDLSNLVGNILLSIFSKNSLVLQSLNKLMHKKNWRTTIFFNFEHKKSRFADKAETSKYKYAWFIMINYSCLTIQ